jgi:hypothetical protein
VHEIILAPLAREDLGRLIADALPCEPERVTPLAQLVTDSTWQDREGEQSNYELRSGRDCCANSLRKVFAAKRTGLS